MPNKTPLTSSVQQKSEKSREEVMAERAAKKQAKMAAKNKEKEDVKTVLDSKQEEKKVVSSKSGNNVTQDKNVMKLTKETEKLSVSGDHQINLSKEEILAQRELKKKQKQDGKTKESKGKAAIVQTEKPSNEETQKPVKTPNEGEKSKAQLRAERRAIQEAQRAVKAQPKASIVNIEVVKVEKNKVGAKIVKQKIVRAPVLAQMQRLKLFAHLFNNTVISRSREIIPGIHPSVAKLGAQYESRIIAGSNARCLALLSTLKKVVFDFETPSDKVFTRSLEGNITNIITFLSQCRPASVSMLNSVKMLKSYINQIQDTTSEKDIKNQIIEWIDTFIRDQLDKAAEAIYLKVKTKITDNDVILTYGCSSLIYRMLVEAHKQNIKFQVVVVDGRPWLEGREMLRRLVKANITCSYILVNAISFIIPQVTKVLLGAHALLANGYVMSRVGSSQVALMAKAHNVPVLVCCETYKFCERVQTDSFVYNEMGNPNDLITTPCSHSQTLINWQSLKSLTLLNINYDVTPPDLVSAVVTELGILPCTSVPVILRIKPTEIMC